jgi:hypothetical protein
MLKILLKYPKVTLISYFIFVLLKRITYAQGSGIQEGADGFDDCWQSTRITAYLSRFWRQSGSRRIVFWRLCGCPLFRGLKAG